jgi:hypothetical protein
MVGNQDKKLKRKLDSSIADDVLATDFGVSASLSSVVSFRWKIIDGQKRTYTAASVQDNAAVKLDP